MTEKSGAGAAPVGVELFLLGSFTPLQLTSQIKGTLSRLARLVTRRMFSGLTRHPGAGQIFVVETDDHTPFTRNSGQTVENVGVAFGVAFRIVQRVQGPSARVHQVVDALPTVIWPRALIFSSGKPAV